MIKRFVGISFRHSEWKEGKKTDIEKREMMELKKIVNLLSLQFVKLFTFHKVFLETEVEIFWR